MDLKLLKTIMDDECKALSKLLDSLDKQYRLIMKNEVIELEAVVDEIKICNKNIAEFEVKRRELLEGKSLKEVVLSSGNEELENSFRETRKIVELLKLQKDNNDLLLKQQVSYTNKMLRILNPSRQAKTYNSYGRINV